MSQISIQPQIKATIRIRPPALQIETGENYENQQKNPPSQVWYQYSQFNIKTPTSQKFPNKNTSQYIQFSNNLYSPAGKSQYVLQSEKDNEQEEVIDTGKQETNNLVGQKSKFEFVSQISISEEFKKQIIGNSQQRKKDDQKINTEECIEILDSFLSTTSYQQRDLRKQNRKFILEKKQQQRKPKQIKACGSCSIM